MYILQVLQNRASFPRSSNWSTLISWILSARAKERADGVLEMESIHLHEDSAFHTRAKAGEIIVEPGGNTEANVVGDCKQQAVASETTVNAEEDIAIRIPENTR